MEKEEQRAWEGWWNEQIVELIKLSMEQKDALTVLLTGRSERQFASLISRMIKSKGLECDMVVLKPQTGPNGQKFSSTMVFKQAFLETLMETYKDAEELRIYEDRIKHVKGFRDFFMDYNKRQNGIGGQRTRGPIVAEVIQVADGVTLLDPVVEAAEVQKLINDHNAKENPGKRHRKLMIKKTVFYTGYLITNTDSQKLLTLANLSPNMPESEMKYLANNVMITPRPAPASILEKVGGMGNKLLWEVTGTAVLENKIWAAQVRPVPSTAQYYTENPTPIVVLALRKGARPIDANKIQNWQPVSPDKAYIFETTVGEKVLLRVEDESPEEDSYESLFPNKNNKRKHQNDDSGHQSGNYSSRNNGHNNNTRGGRGGRGGNNNFNNSNHRGGKSRGNNDRGRGGRGRGNGKSYHSLDDTSSHQNTNYNNSIPYDDAFPALGGNASQNHNSYAPQQQSVGYQPQYQNYAQSTAYNPYQPQGGAAAGGNGNGGLSYY